MYVKRSPCVNSELLMLNIAEVVSDVSFLSRPSIPTGS